MQRYTQFDPLIITSIETDQWAHPLHNHNHFELIYISEGKGTHFLNNKQIPYTKGSLFLLGPEDAHKFQIEQKTTFIYLKFTSAYFNTHPDGGPDWEWRDKFHLLFRHADKNPGNLLYGEEDKNLMDHLFQAALLARKKKESLYEFLIYQLISFVLTLVKKHYAPVSFSENAVNRPVLEGMILYIDEHIQEPKKLTLSTLADTFHYSPNYIGILFREKTGITLTKYINKQRLKLIERQLKYEKNSLKQVVYDFGFTDESHLNKFFKRQKGINPSEFKKMYAHC